MTRLSYCVLATVLFAVLAISPTRAFAQSNLPQMDETVLDIERTDTDRTARLDQRHVECLERIAQDQELALEEAMIWRDQGGGRRARHCEAMALFALGYEGEAASRLDRLAAGGDGGSQDHRIKYRSEAANFWLAEGNASRAYASATAGLDMAPKHADLRIARARAYALNGRPDYAETDLTTVLAYHPRHAEALRYRADARLRQNRLDGAKDDIERSLQIDFTSIETALLRGRINEAIRLAALEETGEVNEEEAEKLSQETLDDIK